MRSVEKQGPVAHLLLAAFGSILGLPFLLLGSAVGWLLARGWAGLTIETTAYAALVAWMVFVVLNAALAMAMAPKHTDKLPPWRANVVEFVSCIVAAGAGFSIMADHPVPGAIVGIGVGLVMIGGYEWMTSGQTLTEDEQKEAWARVRADLRKEFGSDEDPR